MKRVIKVGGRAQQHPALPAAIAEAWGAGDNPMVIVHGGGDEVTALQAALGSTPQFLDGRRVTSAEDIEIVRMALSGSANKRLVSSLVGEGVHAVGLSGEDASLIAATPTSLTRLGHVGVPQRVNVSLLRHLLDGGYVPVVSPVSRNTSLELGCALNVNGDDAAGAIAVAMNADELLLLVDVPGVFRRGQPIAQLGADEARSLVADGTAKNGMVAKLEAALAALDGGVDRVRIADIAAINDRETGTILVRDGRTP